MKAELRDSRMLTTTEVAHLLHIHPNTVRQWANKGLLPTYRLGARCDRRFKREHVEAFINDNSHK